MKFNFKEKHNNINVGDVIFSHASECHYIVVREFIAPNYRYRLLCLDDATMMSRFFECIDDIIDCQFSAGQYDVILKEDLVLSNGV